MKKVRSAPVNTGLNGFFCGELSLCLGKVERQFLNIMQIDICSFRLHKMRWAVATYIALNIIDWIAWFYKDVDVCTSREEVQRLSGEGYFRLSAFGQRENVIGAVERIEVGLRKGGRLVALLAIWEVQTYTPVIRIKEQRYGQ